MFCTKAGRSTRSSPLVVRPRSRRRLVIRTVLYVHVGGSELNDAQVMGPNIHAGEVLQLLVPTGVWKMSKLLDDDLTAALTEGTKDHCGCLITEVVFPGFAWEDHGFLTRQGLIDLWGNEDAPEVKELAKYLKKE